MSGEMISLDSSEIISGAMIGIMRRVSSMQKGCLPAYGAESDSCWQIDIEGALGELALAKHLDKYRAGTGGIRTKDVGEFEVKTSRRETARLILHDEMPDDLIVWLVTGQYGEYRIRGWIRAGDGKKKKWWADPTGKGRPAYFVPQSELR